MVDPYFLNIIVPAYNEEQNISETIRTIREIQERVKIPHKLIVVNDNSTDRTREIVQELQESAENIVLVNRRGNHGNGRCLNRAYEEVSGAILVAVMADLADDVNIIPVMLEKLRRAMILSGLPVHTGRLRGTPGPYQALPLAPARKNPENPDRAADE